MLIPMSIVLAPDDLVPFNEVVMHPNHQDLWHWHTIQDSDQDPEVPTPPPLPGGLGPIEPDLQGEPVAY